MGPCVPDDYQGTPAKGLDSVRYQRLLILEIISIQVHSKAYEQTLGTPPHLIKKPNRKGAVWYTPIRLLPLSPFCRFPANATHPGPPLPHPQPLSAVLHPLLRRRRTGLTPSPRPRPAPPPPASSASPRRGRRTSPRAGARR